MVHKNADMVHMLRENIRGGKGMIETDMVYKGEELLGKATLFNRLAIKPGSSIGEHAHTEDAEIYYVLEGEITALDNGNPVVMHKGDCMFTGGGETHALENRSGADAVILAIVLA